MPAVELGSRWKMPDGKVWRVGAIVVDPFEATVLCESEQHKNCVAHWPAILLVNTATKITKEKDNETSIVSQPA